MALINYASKEITLKIVYYGPGLSGKTTNLQHLHSIQPARLRSKLISLSTESDRTLFFDFMPVSLGKISDFTIKLQLYTVPGQVRYNATRKLVLKGADAVVLVVDSQSAMREQNMESLQNMRNNLTANSIDPDDIPIVLQYNKRDLKDILTVGQLDADLNSAGHETVMASATEGTGVEETYQTIIKRLLKHFSMRHNIRIEPPSEPAPTPDAPDAESYVIERPGMQDTVVDTGSMAQPVEEEEATHIIIRKREQAELASGGPDLRPLLNDMAGLSQQIKQALAEISSDIKGSRTEDMLEELMYSSESIKNALPELTQELRESHKGQAEILKVLKAIAAALNNKPPGQG